jgi:hypothetical protein
VGTCQGEIVLLQCICMLLLIRSKSRPDEDTSWSKHVVEWIIYTVGFDGFLFISFFREHDTFGARGAYWGRGTPYGLVIAEYERS